LGWAIIPYELGLNTSTKCNVNDTFAVGHCIQKFKIFLFTNQKSNSMSIGPDARRWFSLNHGDAKNKMYTSKYYLPEESWPKTHVWWLQIPLDAIDRSRFDYVNIVCQVAPGKNSFHYLVSP